MAVSTNDPLGGQNILIRPPATEPVDTRVVSRLARCVLPTHKKQPSQNSQVTENQDRVVFLSALS